MVGIRDKPETEPSANAKGRVLFSETILRLAKAVDLPKGDFLEEPSGVEITTCAKTESQTGVEMEALTAVSIAALTIADMIKAVEKSARIAELRSVEKQGGVSGDFLSE